MDAKSARPGDRRKVETGSGGAGVGQGYQERRHERRHVHLCKFISYNFTTP